MNIFLLFLVLCVVTHINRTVYEILKIRNRVNPENKLVFAAIFTNMILLWISWFGLCVADPGKLSLNPVFKYAGGIIFICATMLFILSLARVKKFENYHGELITDGLYRYLRHPMYLGFILWMAGSTLFFQSWIAGILTVIFTLNILVWKKLEEIQLMKIYPAYKDYMKKTWF